MDSEVEDFLDKNNTDDLNDFLYQMDALDYIQDIIAITFTLIGFISDVLIVYMIARNGRMRSKTNLIIMNLAINDGLFLLSNIHFLAALLELMGARHLLYYYDCLMGYTDANFQMNVIIFLIILGSNTLIKNKRVHPKWILIVVYSFIGVNFMGNAIVCNYSGFPFLYFVCFLAFIILMGMVLFKEVNNCYKKWYKKDPLSVRTRLRLNVVRIYVGCWFVTFLMYVMSEFGGRFLFFTMATQCFMSSAYILLYLANADKFFKICLLNLLRCKGAGEYDVDATITFADESSDEENTDNNHVNINFNANRVPQTEVQDISTIRVS